MPPREAAKQRRDIGMVFQHFNLFPHRTALANIIEAPIHVKGVKKKEAVERAHDLLNQVGLTEKAGRLPRAAVRRAQQRVAIARALAMNPVDAVRRTHLGAGSGAGRRGTRRDEKLAEEGMTMVVVTHEMGLAREVANQLVFMDEGIIMESGNPREMMANPQHERTKAFLSKVL